ncbi:hypothetical protein V1478_014666 [Vespula squamosa]|uniref:Uncharacterized protein n=1 Tax=Vespula squamosa TaxID=30214 RepID=A0ABD2A2Y8_VESSQ
MKHIDHYTNMIYGHHHEMVTIKRFTDNYITMSLHEQDKCLEAIRFISSSAAILNILRFTRLTFHLKSVIMVNAQHNIINRQL